MNLFLFDDRTAREFEPYSMSRPVSELRAGAELIRARWERVAGTPATGAVASPTLADFAEAGAPRMVTAGETLPAGSIVASSRFAPKLDARLLDGSNAWTSGERVCAVRVARDLSADTLLENGFTLDALVGNGTVDGAREELEGMWLDGVWDLVVSVRMIADDIRVLATEIERTAVRHSVIGTHDVCIENGVVIEPYVVFDASAGPILIGRNAHVSAFTRIAGPCFIGEGTVIQGDRISNCAIGEMSKVHGELSNTIVLGYSNKGHTGFVGHSYLGRWVNLGSGTTTSNLKNTYGTVQLDLATGKRETGMQFLGTLFGDHVKTGIGTMLTTGTILGVGANVFGNGPHPKRVTPFGWGSSEPYDRFAADKFIVVAERVMARRGIMLDDNGRRYLQSLHDRAAR